MSGLSVKELVRSGNVVRFERYQKGELWYSVHTMMPFINSETGERTGEGVLINSSFEFPVHVGDTGDGVFLKEDKALFFMRYIRKHVEYLQTARNDQTT